MKKEELYKIKQRLSALTLAGAITLTMASCAKSNSNTKDYEIIPDTSLSYEENLSSKERIKATEILSSLFESKTFPSFVPNKVNYNVAIDANKLNYPSSNVSNTHYFAIITSGTQVDKLKPFDGKSYVKEEYYNDSDELLEIPNNINISKDTLLSATNKEEYIAVLKEYDGDYYVYQKVTYTFNDKIDDISSAYFKPAKEDTMTLITFARVRESVKGLDKEYFIRLQTGFGSECANVISKNIGTINAIKCLNEEQQKTKTL